MPVWVCSSLVSSVIQSSCVCMTLCGEHVCTVGRVCMGPGGDACLSQEGDRGDSRQGSIQSPQGSAGILYACRRCVMISTSHWCKSMCPSGGTLEEDGLIIGMCDGYCHVYMCYVCSSVAFDEGTLVSQMSRWRGGHQGKGGGRRAAKRAELRGGSISSRLGSTYSVSRSTGVLCGQRCFSVEWGAC